MVRPRISIAGMMILLVALGLVLSSLRFPSEGAAAAVLLVTQAILAVAVLAVGYSTQERRAFWLGFAVFGCGNLAQASGPQTARRLPTTAPLEWLRSVMSLGPRSPGDRLLVMRQGSPTPAMILEVKDGTYKVTIRIPYITKTA